MISVYDWHLGKQLSVGLFFYFPRPKIVTLGLLYGEPSDPRFRQSVNFQEI